MKINKITKLGILSGLLIVLAVIFVILGVGFVRGGCGGDDASKSESTAGKEESGEITYIDVGEEERLTEEDIETDKFLESGKAKSKTEKKRKVGTIWARSYPKRGITGKPVTIKGQIAGYKMGKVRIVAGNKIGEKRAKIMPKGVELKKGKLLAAKSNTQNKAVAKDKKDATKTPVAQVKTKNKKAEDSRKTNYKKLNLKINNKGAFSGVFVPKTGGTHVVSIGVEDLGNNDVSVFSVDVDVSNSGIPDIDIPDLTGGGGPEVPPVTGGNPFEFPCVQGSGTGTIPADEVFSLHFREQFVGDMIKLHLSRYISERRMCAPILYPDGLSQEFFQNGTHNFTDASDLGDFLGMDFDDVVFTIPFDLRTLLNQAISGEENDIPDDIEDAANLLTTSAAEVRIPGSSITINWDNMINSISVDFVEYDPSVKVWFSANANISAIAAINILGLGNPIDLIYQLLFPTPPPFVNIPILLNNVTVKIEGVADIVGGEFTNTSITIVPNGTNPWELAEIDAAFTPSIAAIETWIAGIVSQLTAVATLPPLGTPGAADELAFLLNLVPIIGPALTTAVSVAAPFAGTILWLGTLAPTDPDRSIPFDFASGLSFENIMLYGFRHIMLSFITNLVQNKINGTLAEFDFNSWLSDIPINMEEPSYTLTLGPKRMNANYPENTNFSLLGGSFSYTMSSIPGAQVSCLIGTAPSVSPTIPSDFFGNPAAIDVAWSSMIDSNPWGVSINFHEKLFQGIINQAAANGLFCSNSSSSNSSPGIISSVYPQIVLNTTAVALPITSGVPITVGSLIWSGVSGAPGVVFNASDSSQTYQVGMNLEADFNIVITADNKLNFNISNVAFDNLSIAGLDPVSDALIYFVVSQLITTELSTLVYDGSQFGFDGIDLPFGENCLELVGYGAWQYCDRPDRAMGLMIRSNSNNCPEIECPEINTTQID